MLVNASDMLKNALSRPLRFGRLQHQQPGMDARYSPGCREAKSPLIMQCFERRCQWMGSYKVCADMVVLALRLDITVPVACTSIMVPMRIASRPWMQALHPLCTTVLTRPTSRTNLDRTKGLWTSLTRGLSIEAEVGGIGARGWRDFSR